MSSSGHGVSAWRAGAGIVVLVVLIVLAAAWQWSSLGEWLDPLAIAGWLEQRAGHPAAPLVAIGAFVPASAMAIPVTVLVVITIVSFGLAPGIVYAFAGILLAASALYAAGSWLGRDTIRSLAPDRVRAVSEALGRRGVSAMAIVRMVPVAHFTIINLIAGASHIRFRHYLLGTAIGMAPGLVLVSFVVNRARASLEHPGWETVLALLAALVLLALLTFGARRWLERGARQRKP